MKTNKEILSELDNERWFTIVDWLFHKYGRGFTDTHGGILQWLDKTDLAEAIESEQHGAYRGM